MTFFQRPTDGQRIHERCSTSLIGEMQIKIKRGITSHLSEWLLSINQQATSADKEVEKKECLCTVGGNLTGF